MQTQSVDLPGSMADLLQIAIDDGRTLSREFSKLDKLRYVPHYNHWCRNEGNQCFMCAAGAILLARFDYTPVSDGSDDVFLKGRVSPRWQTLLIVVDRMRTGNWPIAAYEFYGDRIKYGHYDAFGLMMYQSTFKRPGKEFVDGIRRIEAEYQISSKIEPNGLVFIDDGLFEGWNEYDAWLEYAETLLLPILRRNEREILKMSDQKDAERRSRSVDLMALAS